MFAQAAHPAGPCGSPSVCSVCQDLGWVPRDEDEARCRICGCTEDAACEGGCSWIPDPLGIGDVCSRCEWVASILPTQDRRA